MVVPTSSFAFSMESIPSKETLAVVFLKEMYFIKKGTKLLFISRNM